MKSFKKAFRKGFSLIELSVVLIIIGLLMAAIIKGRDLIRSAEMKKFYNTFVKAWELVYTQYYDRTGQVLGAPLETNKGNYTEFVGANYTVSNTDFVLRDPSYITKQADDVGVDRPQSTEYFISFSNIKAANALLTFASDPVSKSESITVYKNGDKSNNATLNGKGNGKGNFMVIFNVPYDVAIQIDRIVDGRADGSKGAVICGGAYSSVLNEISNVDETYLNSTDLEKQAKECNGGVLGWGTKDKPFVTLIYKLGI